MVDPTHQQNNLKIEHFVFNADSKHSAYRNFSAHAIRPHLSAEGNWQLIQAGAVIFQRTQALALKTLQ
jgi:hypothetical protein